MIPWMDKADIVAIEKQILSLNRSHVDVLEWGSGGSTEYFTKFMTENGIAYDWISIEYNREWYQKVCDLNIPFTTVVLFDAGNAKLKQRNTNMDKYVGHPLTLDRKFDLVIVDGRKRRRCLINASKIVSDDGVVILHDAQRSYYHCAFNCFASHKFLTNTLWMGRNV